MEIIPHYLKNLNRVFRMCGIIGMVPLTKSGTHFSKNSYFMTHPNDKTSITNKFN